MEDKYQYIKFGLLPFAHESIVSPFTPLSLGKKMYKITYTLNNLSIPASGVLEGVVIEPFTTTSTNQAPVGLHIAVNPTYMGTYVQRFGTQKELQGLPSVDSMFRYIGGYLKITNGSAFSPTFSGRCYEPLSNFNVTDWSEPSLTTSPITTFSNYVGPVYISCIPKSLDSKTVRNETAGHFPRTNYHFKLFNTVTTEPIIVHLYGEWWVEIYEPMQNTEPYVQDTMLPYKLAEYILGDMRNSYIFTLEQDKIGLYNGLESAIDLSLTNIINKWKVMTSDITIQSVQDNGNGGGDGNEDDSDEEWESRPRLWNP